MWSYMKNIRSEEESHQTAFIQQLFKQNQEGWG